MKWLKYWKKFSRVTILLIVIGVGQTLFNKLVREKIEFVPLNIIVTLFSLFFFSFLHGVNFHYIFEKRNPNLTIYWKIRRRIKKFQSLYTGKVMRTSVESSNFRYVSFHSFTYVIDSIEYNFPVLGNLYCCAGFYHLRIVVYVRYNFDNPSLNLMFDGRELHSMGYYITLDLQRQIEMYFNIPSERYLLLIIPDLNRVYG